jgi:hypothetical protein
MLTLMPWRLVALTFEQKTARTWALVVRHEFYGATEAEARAVYAAHLQADRFLAGCSHGAGYQGIVCRTETYLERHTG